MKAYKVTRTITQEFISFGKNKEEAYENSYDIKFNLEFLNYEGFSAQGEVVGGSYKSELVNDTVVISEYSLGWDSSYKDDVQELVNAGANILIKTTDKELMSFKDWLELYSSL